MNFIRNLDDNTRTWVYATLTFIKFSVGVALAAFALGLLEYLFGTEEAYLIAAVAFGLYLAVSMSIFSAKSKVREEQRMEAEVLRRLRQNDN